jgi:hypothetical protein
MRGGARDDVTDRRFVASQRGWACGWGNRRDRLACRGYTGGRGVFGQTSAESWTVLADLEGNEFCVARPKRTLVD